MKPFFFSITSLYSIKLRNMEEFMKRLLPLLFVMAAIFYCGESEGREWVSFESDDVYQYAYNEDSIAQSGKDTVKVWVRWEGKDQETRQKIIAQREAKKELYQEYQGSKQLMEINCSKGTMDVLTSTDYKTNGDTIWSMTFSSRDPQPIPLESRIGRLANIVCKKK
jgi:hypothetical protein